MHSFSLNYDDEDNGSGKVHDDTEEDYQMEDYHKPTTTMTSKADAEDDVSIDQDKDVSKATKASREAAKKTTATRPTTKTLLSDKNEFGNDDNSSGEFHDDTEDENSVEDDHMPSKPDSDAGAGSARMGSGDQGPNTAQASNTTTIGVSILIGVVGLGVIAMVVTRQMRKRRALRKNAHGVEFQQVPADGDPPMASIIKSQDSATQEALIP